MTFVMEAGNYLYLIIITLQDQQVVTVYTGFATWPDVTTLPETISLLRLLGMMEAWPQETGSEAICVTCM